MFYKREPFPLSATFERNFSNVECVWPCPKTDLVGFTKLVMPLLKLISVIDYLFCSMGPWDWEFAPGDVGFVFCLLLYSRAQNSAWQMTGALSPHVGGRAWQAAEATTCPVIFTVTSRPLLCVSRVVLILCIISFFIDLLSFLIFFFAFEVQLHKC